jgi:hypothetical protein
MPGDTIGQKISLRVSRLFGEKTPQHPPSHLLPPKRADLLAGTHPSEHSGVALFKHKFMNDINRHNRQSTYRRREKKAQERKRDNDYYMGADPFWGAPFLFPVPVYYYGAACSAVASGVHGNSNCGGSGCATGVGVSSLPKLIPDSNALGLWWFGMWWRWM